MNQENQVFEQLRKIPTALSEQEMEKIINEFPGKPLQPLNQFDWKKLLNFKNIIMLAILCSLTFGLLLLNPTVSEKPTATTIDHPIEITPEIATNDGISDLIASAEKSDDQPVKVLGTKRQIAVRNPASAEINPVKADQTRPVSSSQNKLQQKASPSPSTVATPKPEIRKEGDAISGRGISIPVTNLKPDFTIMSDLSNAKLKKIRKSLYKNLLADGIISSKAIPVEMRLPGDKFYVNGQEIPVELLPKYARLTAEVKSGPNRKIKIGKKYILIGDFNPDGFRGSGLGTFDDALLENIGMKKQEFDFGYQKLFDFANSLRTPLAGGPSLFGVNLNYENCRLLKSRLYAQLVADQFVENTDEFVVIQHQPDKLIINGTALSGEQKATYLQLISQFKIKAGKHREILLSDRIICVGDYTSNQFTGTMHRDD